MFLLLLLVPFALALVVLAFVGFAGIGPLSDERRADRGGVVGAIGPAVGLLIGSVLLVGALIASVMLVGADGGDNPERGTHGGPSETARATEPPTAPHKDHTTVTTRPPARGTRPAARLGPMVTIEADDGATFPASYDVADGLDPSTVLRVRATGFEPFARATVQQCIHDSSPRCGNRFPVQLDADGAAELQYLVTDDFLAPPSKPGRCRVNTARCTIVVQAMTGLDRGEIHTVFIDRVPPAGRISVSPSSGLSLEGETVTVNVDGYPPGAQLIAMLCAAPDATGTRCGAPGPTAPLLVARDGTGRAELALEPGRVGAERAPCFRGDDCGVSVASETVFARAPVAPISFAAPPGTAYDPTRLLIGLGVALLLVVIAATLLRRTEWSPIGEAAAPEIDDAQYADLDAIIAALPPIEEDTVPTR